MQEKVLAEAKLTADVSAVCRLIRAEDGGYCTEYEEYEEYEEGPTGYGRNPAQSLPDALTNFIDNVVQDAIEDGEQERGYKFLAEARSRDGSVRVIQTEDGDYYTAYDEGDVSPHFVYPNLLKALRDFADAVVEEERRALAHDEGGLR
ncbi:MAG: hypothetical protein M3P49_04165 [Actinomycetota bacterium]|nr:hypothetical protein [Actinomycetota bacterium]